MFCVGNYFDVMQIHSNFVIYFSNTFILLLFYSLLSDNYVCAVSISEFHILLKVSLSHIISSYLFNIIPIFGGIRPACIS